MYSVFVDRDESRLEKLDLLFCEEVPAQLILWLTDISALEGLTLYFFETKPFDSFFAFN